VALLQRPTSCWPGRPAASLEEELDEVDQNPDEIYVHSGAHHHLAQRPVLFGKPSPLKDPQVRERTLDLAEARGPRQAAFAQRLIADPHMVRTRVRRTLQECEPAFFTDAWRRIRPRLTADLRLKADLLAPPRTRRDARRSLAAISLDQTGEAHRHRQNSRTTRPARSATRSVRATVFGHPHLVTVHAPGWRPVVQYPVSTGTARDRVGSPHGPRAAAHRSPRPPVRMRLIRTLARGAHTTSELASTWQLSAPEVSRTRPTTQGSLLTTQRRGRYVLYELDLSATAAIAQT